MRTRWLLLLSGVLVSGCPLLVDDELEVVDADGGAGASTPEPVAGKPPATTGGRPPVSTGGMPTDVAGAPPDMPGAAGAPSCEDVAPPANAKCPATCDRCEGSVCILECATEAACKDKALACPAGLACRVSCRGKGACEGASIACAPEYGCELTCEGDSACKDASLMCADGRCALTCGLSLKSCEKLNVTCGAGPCVAQCPIVGPKPNVDCANSCGCTPC